MTSRRSTPELVEELRVFHHNEAADRLEYLAKKAEPSPRWTPAEAAVATEDANEWARSEAIRKADDHTDHHLPPNFPTPYDKGFADGAEWQEGRKIVVTDEMVERAAQSLCNGNFHEYPHTDSDRDRYRTSARAALAAALKEP